MSAGGELFDLISRLSASERRYFRLFSKKNDQEGDLLYLTIFDILEESAVWDEKELLAKVKNTRLETQLAEMTTYLQKMILRSLRSYHSTRRPDFKLREMLMNVEVLLDKDLVPTAWKELNRLRSLALKLERFEYMPEIHSLEITLYLRSTGLNLEKLNQKLQKQLHEAETFAAKFFNMLAYKKLSLEMFLLNRRDQKVTSEKTLAAYRKLMDDPLLAQTGEPQSLKARIFHLQSLSIFHMAGEDREAAFQASSGIVQVMEENPELISERPENYIASVQNLVNMSVVARSNPETLQLLQKLKDLPEGEWKRLLSKEVRSRALLFAWHYELLIYYSEGMYAEGAALADHIEKWLQQNRTPGGVNEGYIVSAIHFNSARMRQQVGNYAGALTSINRILNSPSMSPQFELFLSARIFQLVLYYDLEEFTLLEYTETSLSRFLRKRGEVHPAETALLKFLKKAARTGAKIQDATALEKFSAEVTSALNHTHKSAAFNQFDVLRWINRIVSDAGKSQAVKAKKTL